MEVIVVIILTVMIIVASSVLNGYVLSVLWGWFFVPILGLPALSIPQAIGIAIVVGFLTKQIDSTKKEYQDSSKAVIASFIYPLTALLMGWIVKGFM